jgi:hypothetical protein
LSKTESTAAIVDFIVLAGSLPVIASKRISTSVLIENMPTCAKA